MYADPSVRRRFDPVSFGAALAVNGLIISAMIFAVPNFVRLADPESFPIVSYPDDQPPPPPVDEVEPKEKAKSEVVRDTPPYVPPTTIDTTSTVDIVTTKDLPIESPPVQPGKPLGDVDTVKFVPPPPLLPATADPRFARDFQPDYPATELRLQREGNVAVRIRIGADGRVKEVQQVSATSSAFFEATRRHALARWRFKPASRGGKAEDSWKTMSVRFVITGG
jgi:protein TonB